LSRVIAIEPLRALQATRLLVGNLSPAGTLSRDVGPPGVETPPVVKTLVGGLFPEGEVVGLSGGPSIVTVPKELLGSLLSEGEVTIDVETGTPIGVATKDIAGILAPIGSVAGIATGPSLVTILKTLLGGIGLGGDLDTLIPPSTVTLTKFVGGVLGLSGTIDGIATGPSIVTLLKSIAGTATPAGALTTDTFVPPGTVETEDVDGTITPAGDLATAVSGPSFVTVPQAVAGTITPAGGFTKVANTVVIPKSIAGTITPAGARSASVSGPSLVTVPRNVNGSITPSGARSAIVIPPPVTFFSKAVTGMITPTGALTRLVTGPSLVTIPKLVSGVLVPSSILSRAITGPSLVTVPKAVVGSLGLSGTVARQVTNNPTIQTKAVAGSITPVGTVSTSVSAGTPVGANPLYAGMGAWFEDEFAIHPQWAGLMFSRIPSTTADCASLFAAMRTRGMKGGVAFTNKADMSDVRPDGTFTFNMVKAKALVDRVAAVSNIASYIAGGESELIVVGDEFELALWNNTISPNQAKQLCQYAKQQLPGIKTAIRDPSRHLTGSKLPTGGWAGSLDYGWGQYLGKRDGRNHATILAYYQFERDTMIANGIPGIIPGLNWWNGGDGSSGVPGPEGDPDLWVCTTQEIRAAIDAAIQISQARFFMLWTDAHNTTLSGAAQMLTIQESTAYRAAFQYVKDAGLARGATPATQEFFTDTGFFAAPSTPPNIIVGAGVRDALTRHKVFKLVTGARTQDCEHSALSADNSLIYYIKGTTGYIADLFWRVSFSEVQVTNERIANGTGPANNIDSWIWDRSNAKMAYYAGALNTLIYRRDFRLNSTITMKDIGQDPRFISFWSAVGTTVSRIDGLHANRTQEKFIAKVLNPSGVASGVVVWGRFTNNLWNYQTPVGKVIRKVQMDDPGLYMIVSFTDGSWQVGRLDSPGLINLSAIQTAGPGNFDIGNLTGVQHAFQGSGLGTRSWAVDPIAASPTTRYAHPLRGVKQDLFSQAKASLQGFDNRIAYMMHYQDTIRTLWIVESGATYRVDWAAEMLLADYKQSPEVVRVNGIQYTRVPVP
jgi:hypothetical protein